MSNPALPIITLTKGPWRAEIFDPRADPMALGARYVHGCYVRALWRGERKLTGRCDPDWDRFDGEGLPETFETSYGWGAAGPNDEYLRIGAGRLRRTDNIPRETAAHAPLVTTLDWRITERDDDVLAMATEDSLIGGWRSRYGYRLERRVRLRDDGLDSTTRLTLTCDRWQSHPVTWFAHPFFAQDGLEGTAIALPGSPSVDGTLTRGPDGLYRVGAWPGGDSVQGRGVATGLWGERGAIVAHLDQRRGGGRLAIQLDRPLDHAVVFATTTVCSVEPKLARTWPHGETAEWTLSYRWLD
jgi:hypothetical protein